MDCTELKIIIDSSWFRVDIPIATYGYSHHYLWFITAFFCRLQLFNTLSSLPVQRFSNWGPRTKGGPRRVPTGSARRFRKVVIVCMVFNNLRSIFFKICTQLSHSVSVHCVEVLPWFGFLLMSLSSAARDLLTTLMIGSSLLWEMLWLSVSVIKKTKLH